MSEVKRTPPENIKRQLRREAGFGCCVCGQPIIEYHHIIPWAEVKHHDPAHMVVLCPNHHRELGKLDPKRGYEAKAKPCNIASGNLSGLLGGNVVSPKVRIGSQISEGFEKLIRFAGFHILEVRYQDGIPLLNLSLPGEDYWPELCIRDNELRVNTREIWDIHFRTNYLKVQKRQRDSDYLVVDFRSGVLTIECKIRIDGQMIEIGKNGLRYSTPSGPLMEQRGLSYIYKGDSSKAPGLINVGTQTIVPPNYAMAIPTAKRVANPPA